MTVDLPQGSCPALDRRNSSVRIPKGKPQSRQKPINPLICASSNRLHLDCIPADDGWKKSVTVCSIIHVMNQRTVQIHTQSNFPTSTRPRWYLSRPKQLLLRSPSDNAFLPHICGLRQKISTPFIHPTSPLSINSSTFSTFHRGVGHGCPTEGNGNGRVWNSQLLFLSPPFQSTGPSSCLIG